MDQLFPNLENCIDEKGQLLTAKNVKLSHQAAEALCESLLGSTLNIRGNKFIIRMLEIYYGSVGDVSHDWYRNRFVYKTSKYINQTTVQADKGFRIYLSSPDVKNTYTRLDIVVGNKDVAISFLLRSIWDANFNLIGTKKGSPNIVLNAMGIKPEDHGVEILVHDPHTEISIENTHDKIYKERSLQTKRSRRINITSGFESDNGLEWNFYAEPISA